MNKVVLMDGWLGRWCLGGVALALASPACSGGERFSGDGEQTASGGEGGRGAGDDGGATSGGSGSTGGSLDCDDGVAGDCSTAGSAGSGGGAARQCEPDEEFCAAGSVRRCAEDGLSSEEVEACGAGKYCETASASCKAGACAPGEPACDGERATTCNDDGSDYLPGGETCGNGTSCVDGACRACTPDELRCDGQQPQKCSASGAWAANGATCTGESICDAEGSKTCSASPTIPGGTFNRLNDATAPATLSTFALDRYEVTVGEFRKFVTAALGGYRPASGAGKHTHLNAGKGLAIGAAFEAGWDTAWNKELALASAAAWDTELSCHASLATWTSAAGENETRPLNCANWWQAYAFCIWDGGFLPSDAEWNYAAAGGAEQRLYPWGPTPPGTDSSLAVHNCSYDGKSSCGGFLIIAPVGSVPAGNGRWGHSDLAGNLAEWTKDFGTPKPCTDCAADLNAARTIRGGYFGTTDAAVLATTSIQSGPPDLNNPSIGFRCARSFAP
jgi:formylglycine-generating enzyme